MKKFDFHRVKVHLETSDGEVFSRNYFTNVASSDFSALLNLEVYGSGSKILSVEECKVFPEGEPIYTLVI